MHTDWTNTPPSPNFENVSSASYDAPMILANFIRQRVQRNQTGRIFDHLWQHGTVVGRYAKLVVPPGMKGKTLSCRYVNDFMPNVLGALWLGRQYLETAMRAPDPTRLVLEIPPWTRTQARLFYEVGETGRDPRWKLVQVWDVQWNWLLSLPDIVNLVHQEVRKHEQPASANRATGPRSGSSTSAGPTGRAPAPATRGPGTGSREFGTVRGPAVDPSVGRRTGVGAEGFSLPANSPRRQSSPHQFRKS